MQWFKRILVIALVLAVAALSITFVVENQQPSSLAFLGLESPEWPVSLFVALAFAVGGLGGLLLNIPFQAASRYRVRMLSAELKRLRDEQIRENSRQERAVVNQSA